MANRATAPRLFLQQFFPFHYQVGFAVERAMRDPRLTQQQSVILWIIHSIGERGRSLPRKELEACLRPWFDVTSSAMSKALRSMAQQPLALVKIEENPQSARERTIVLTRDGEHAVAAMVRRGEAYIDRIVGQLSRDEIDQGLNFLARVSAIVDSFPETEGKRDE